MPETRTTSAPKLRTTMRRVRLEKACRATKRRSRTTACRSLAHHGTGAAPVAKSLSARAVISSTPTVRRRSDLLEPVADAVERLDHVEIIVDRFELLAQPLDMAVDRPVVYIDLIIISG